jgi:uncharacterized protein (DUF2336 family)
MYRLEVFIAGSQAPPHVRFVSSASEVLSLIPALLKEHGTCERIEVWMDNARLFSVDCQGNRIGG